MILSAGIAAVVLAAVVSAAWLYASFDPAAEGSWFPRCVFKSLTGLDCPGCGSQRAIHALLHGRFAEALRLNALFVVELPLLLLLGIVALLPGRLRRLRRLLVSQGFILSLLATIVIFTVARNIL